MQLEVPSSEGDSADSERRSSVEAAPALMLQVSSTSQFQGLTYQILETLHNGFGFVAATMLLSSGETEGIHVADWLHEVVPFAAIAVVMLTMCSQKG